MNLPFIYNLLMITHNLDTYFSAYNEDDIPGTYLPLAQPRCANGDNTSDHLFTPTEKRWMCEFIDKYGTPSCPASTEITRIAYRSLLLGEICMRFGINVEVLEYWCDVHKSGANFLLGDDEETPLDDIGAYLVTKWANNADVNSPTFCLDMQSMLHSEMEQSAHRYTDAANRARVNWNTTMEYMEASLV